MKLPLIFMFPGQGSHYYQMRRDLFECNEIFRMEMLKMDEICKDIIKISIIDVFYKNKFSKNQPLDHILLTSPALLMVGYALTRVLFSQGIIPNYILGVSLGELIAAVIAGVLSIDNAIQIAIKHSQVIEEKCKIGSMLAISHPLNIFYGHPTIQNSSELASINSTSNFIISGELESMKVVRNYLNEKQLTYHTLPVKYGFHSSFIDPAASEFLSFMNKQTLKLATLPLISCIKAKTSLTLQTNHFWMCTRELIQFKSTIQHLEKKNSYNYLDLGPSGTLSKFVRSNLDPISKSKVFSVSTPFNKNLYKYLC